MVNDCATSFSQRFYDKLSDLYLYQIVNEPTRLRGDNVPSCLDLVITASGTNVCNLKVLCPIGKCHNVITSDFNVRVNGQVDKDIFRYAYSKGDYRRMCALLRDVDWSVVTDSSDVDITWEFFNSTFQYVIHECVPLVKVNKGNRVDPPCSGNSTAGRLYLLNIGFWSIGVFPSISRCTVSSSCLSSERRNNYNIGHACIG